MSDEKEIRDLPPLKNDPDNPSYWVGIPWIAELWGVEICIYGNAEGPQPERLEVAQTVLQFLEEIEFRAETALFRQFQGGTSPFDMLSLADIKNPQIRNKFRDSIDAFDAWTLLIVYFGVTENEPVDVFGLEFCLGIWGSLPFFAWFRLNSETPEQSPLIKCTWNELWNPAT